MVANYVLEVAHATCLERLWDRHVSKMAEFGIDKLLYGSTRFRTTKSMGNPEDFLILTNHHRSYTDLYFGQRYYVNAPMVNWSLTNHGAVSWQFLHDKYARREFSDEQRKVYEFNQDHGVCTGYSISFVPTSQRQGAGLGLVARKGMSQPEMDELWAEHGTSIEAMCQMLHLKILTLPYARPQRALTQRQREVLEWVGDGKTIQDISIVMDLKPATIEKHLRLARDALNVETTAQAILKASFQNQIFVLQMPADAK